MVLHVVMVVAVAFFFMFLASTCSKNSRTLGLLYAGVASLLSVQVISDLTRFHWAVFLVFFFFLRPSALLVKIVQLSAVMSSSAASLSSTLQVTSSATFLGLP